MHAHAWRVCSKMRSRLDRECGFTLVELMVVLGIAAVLMSIAVNAWADYQRRTLSQSAKETVRAMLSAVRTRALTNGTVESVTFDFAAETVKAGTESRTLTGVDITAFDCPNNKAVASVSTNTITFMPDGTLTATAANGGFGIWIRPRNAQQAQFYMDINPVTGRVKVKRSCP